MRALMGNLTIRNVDDAVIDRLKAQARANERSLEGEVRYLLTRAVSDHLRLAEFRAEAKTLSATVWQHEAEGKHPSHSRGSGSVIAAVNTGGTPRRAGDGESPRCPPPLP
ncbi:MAG: hypothetical protein OXQ93_11510 [Gemmatimonadota bacterium]|nr:hypothetical protein [Gemmatimonadota bacterium]